MSETAVQDGAPADKSLGDIVRDQPAAAAVFERLGFEFCCGGGQSLAEAAAEKGLDANTVSVMLDALPAPGTDSSGHNLTRSSIAEICDHIVTEHHERFREETAKLDDIVATVVRVHGPDHPELADLDRHYNSLRDDMLKHAAREESELFPAAKRLEDGEQVDAALIEELVADHNDTRRALEAIRELCGDYDLDAAFCGTHRLMLMNLRDLEADTHQHVHEENNILFPLIKEKQAA